MTTAHWEPETPQGTPIAKGHSYHWRDQTGSHAPRSVEVNHIDSESGLIVVKDKTNTHYMAVPEELHQSSSKEIYNEGIRYEKSA